MTERVEKAYLELLDYVSKHNNCGRRVKRKTLRMLRMNAWDMKHEKQLNKVNENSTHK